MRKVLIWILPLFALAWSCAKDDAGTAERAKARLTLNILEEGPRLAARAADEKAVQDVNVFLYDVRGIARPQHFYVQGGVLACSVPVGEYEVYAVANLHEDMGAMDRGALLAYEFRMPRNYASLPMSGRAACTVGPKTQSITVSVRRNVAKIVCNISFYGTNYNLKLQSVQMMDMAGVTTLFAEDQQARELCSSELSAMAPYENRKASRTFFLAENCRGEVLGIASQQQKCADNAPAGATFLRIKAQREGKLLTYDVYLGENNTTNFDVRRNTVYTLNIVIKGENVVDTRVDAFEVGISDNFPFEGYQFEGYCLYDPGRQLTITVDDPQKAGDLSATVRLLQGQHGAFLFNGQPLTSSVTLPLNDPSGVYSFSVDYIPGEVFTADNYRLVYEVEVSNTSGYRYTKTFTHDFYNLLTIYLLETRHDPPRTGRRRFREHDGREVELLLYGPRQPRDDIVAGRRAARAPQTGGRIESRRMVCGPRPHAVRFSGKPVPPSHEKFPGYALRGLRAGSRLHLYPCRSRRDELQRRLPDGLRKAGVRGSDRKPMHVQGRRRKDGRRLVEQLRRALSSQRTVAGAGVFLYRMGKLQCRTRISGRLTGPHAPAGPLAGCGDY